MCRTAGEVYREFSVPKKDGALRRVEDPARQLKLVQARISSAAEQDKATGLSLLSVKGRCYVSNAAQHRGNRVVRCLDVRKYFPSTPSRPRVLVLPYRHAVRARRRGRAGKACDLPRPPADRQPLSPILAFFAHYDVWEAVAAICREHGYTLTVYIDD